MDEDIGQFTGEGLLLEVKKLRNAIRSHPDSSKHALCWHHPQRWDLLPEKTKPGIAVPEWPQFLRGCLAYRDLLTAKSQMPRLKMKSLTQGIQAGRGKIQMVYPTAFFSN